MPKFASNLIYPAQYLFIFNHLHPFNFSFFFHDPHISNVALSCLTSIHILHSWIATPQSVFFRKLFLSQYSPLITVGYPRILSWFNLLIFLKLYKKLYLFFTLQNTIWSMLRQIKAAVSRMCQLTKFFKCDFFSFI